MSTLKKQASRKPQSRARVRALIAIAILVCVSVGTASVVKWRSVGPKPAAATSPAPLNPPPPNPPLAKEYIYAGGKLVATEAANAAPTVSITNPANNAVFNAGSNITIDASASDSDGTISQVEFYQGSTLLNTDTTAPYSFTWTNVAAGTYSLTVKATDNAGAVTVSSAVAVISNILPTVSITSPTSGTVTTAPASFTINANASDADGTISKVEFYQGSTLLNTDTVAPYSFNWTNVAAGSYSLTAKAYDNNNGVTTSSAVAVISNAPPSVSITNPAQSAQFTVGNNVTIDATASDSDGSISKVEFYQGSTLLNTDTVAPYSFTWNNVAQGNYALTAKAYDNNNASTISSAINISVVPNNIPVVNITSPVTNSVFTAPASITINATATDSDGTITKVDFYQGTTLIGTDTTSPYSFTWTNVAAGTYSITAKATDNSNAVGTSGTITVKSNALPSVSITNPTNNSVFTAPASIQIDASASDSDGTISKVEFYQGSTLLNTDTVAPFSYTWTNVAAGSYSLTAKAYDNDNAVTTSSAIAVISNAPPTVSITSPVNNAIFTPPATITINATASDADGTISAVEFYQGATLIGTDTTSPYSVTLNNVDAGSYQLSARATDNRGATTTSALVAVTTPTFYDDFNDNSLNTNKWHLLDSSSSAIVSETNQQLRITLPASTTTYNGIVSNGAYDMRGGTAQVEVVQSVSQAGWVDNSMFVQLDGQNYYQIGTGAGSIVFRSRVAGVEDVTNIPYDSVAHRFWRIRHSLSTSSVSFETSPNGAVWTSQKTVNAGFAMTALTLSVNAGAWGANNASPGTAIYNDFQYIPTPGQGPPPILSDDFNDNSLDTAKWDPNNLFSGFVDTSLPLAETSQRLEVGPLLTGASGSHYRGIRSVNTYNMSGSYAYVDVVLPPSSATAADAMFTVGTNVDNFYRLYIEAGSLIGQRKAATVKTTLFTIPFDATNHRFLRIRHDSTTGNVTLDTAPNNAGAPGTWTTRYSETWNASISLSAIIFEMKGGTWQVETNQPGKVAFDNFAYGNNSAPPPPPAPTVTGISPSSGPATGGTAVTITGTGFSSGATVRLGGTTATGVTVVSSTSITATTPAHAAGVVDVTVTNTDNQSGTLTSGFTYNTVPSETVLLADDFNDNSMDVAKWDANNLFSGFTSVNVPIAETGQRLEVGPLLQSTDGSNYRGLRSVNTYNFTGGYCYVELPQAPSSSTAGDAMLTVGIDVNNFYRIYVEAGNLIGQKKIGGTKATLFTIPYDSVNHRYLRIRNSAGSMTLDTAPDSGGTPGTWVQRYSEIWSSSVTLTSMIFEIKGGTWQIESNAPGKAIFDNFRAAVPN